MSQNKTVRFQEDYDPSKPVCDNQDDFNMAVREAIQNNRQKNMEQNQPWAAVSAVIYLIFLVWALMLALRLPPSSERVLHLVFAFLASPLYVLMYYVDAMH